VRGHETLSKKAGGAVVSRLYRYKQLITLHPPSIGKRRVDLMLPEKKEAQKGFRYS